MSEEVKPENQEEFMPRVTLVQHFGNIEGILAAFQPTVNSPAKVCTVTMNVNNISACVIEEVQYFKYNDKEVDAALLKYRATLDKDINHRDVVSLFGDLHKLLEKVLKRTYYMNSGAIITTYISPCITEPVLTDDAQFYVTAASSPDWWMKNNALKTVVEAIREHIPGFSPWRGAKDDFISMLENERNRRSALLPKK
ncbi:hypothetical protein EcSzw1_124 [Escherichia phage EcSzw_1]|nr:hypothetical protein EcSzw2_124 [Escherichia phage EcSzw-2]QAY01060.1 hypothetical protein EcSzw1_124 [Escherichia phage EcSzw_1]